MAPRNARSRCRRGSPSTRRPFRKAGGLRSVSASTSATSSSRDGNIYGDGVNVAARLEGLAEPGGICIARNLYNQVKAKLDLAFEPMGEHRVKNIAEPSIAVLPFDNISGEERYERLAGGVAAEIGET
jgi:class 3 adenylate cyclase